MNQDCDVLVLGGGVIGLTAAIVMASNDYRVGLIDSGSLSIDTSVFDLRVFAINKASQFLWEQLNVWDKINKKRLSPYQNMTVWDGQSNAQIEFDSRTIAAANLGFIVEESILKEALLETIKDYDSITLFPHKTIDSIETQEEHIKLFSKNTTWQGQLLLIADGAQSPARELLNVQMTSWPYKQDAIVARVHTEKPHLNTAYQVFNPDGPLAFLPLCDPHHCSIVWSTCSNRAKKLVGAEEDIFNKELNHSFSNKLGQVKKIGPAHHFPLHMRHVNQYVGERWLILGDAAHTIHPLAGLGLNLGLADISSWLNYLNSIPGPLTTKRRLSAYQRERKHAVWQTIVLMEGFKRLFSNNILPLVALRSFGLKTCNQINPLKRLFIEHASGVSD